MSLVLLSSNESASWRIDRSSYGPIGVHTVAVALSILVVGACQPQGQGQGAAVDTTAIKSTLDSMRSLWETAYAAGDFEMIASIVHEEMKYAPPGRSPIQGRDSVMAYLKRTRPPGATSNIELIEMRILSGEWAYEFGTGTVASTRQGTEEPQSFEYNYLAIFRKTADGWKIYREVISPNKPPPGAQ